MSWVTVIWSMTASACLTLAGIHLLVWWQRRGVWADLLFCLASAATATFAACELMMMRAETPGQFATTLRWAHVPSWVISLALVGFIRLHLRAGRPWLGWTVCALRTAGLLLNFLVGQNLVYLEVTRLRPIQFLGDYVAIPVGVPNPWMLVGQVNLVLLLVFVADAALTVWRRGDRRQALVTGGSIVFFVLAGVAESVLVFRHFVDWPLTASIFSLGIVVAMGFEMSHKTLRAAQLSDDLRESEARMTLAAEAAGFGVWMWTLPTNRVWGSERWLYLFGFASDEAVTFEKVIQRVHPDDRAMVEREVRRALEGRGDYARDYRVVLPDGTQRWVTARGRMVPDANGKPTRMLGASLDITPRKEAEAALQQSDERFRSVAETVGEFIWEVDAAGLYTFASPLVEKTLGYAPRELVGKKHFYDLFEPSVREERKTAAFQVFAARQAFRDFPNANVSKGGKIVHLETSGAPMLDPAGNLIGYRGADADVTARKQSEQEIAQQRSHLAHVARVSNLGQLASSLAHELNQPLGAILRNAEAAELFLAEPSPDLDEVRAILADIRKDDQRAGTVIDRMRALMKRREVQRRRLDLGLLASEVVALVRPDAELHQVRLWLEPSPALPPVQGDPAQLQQVVLNLLLNAMDALSDNPPGSRLVTVRARAAGKTVEVTVSDNGQGIAADKLPRLFEPFFTSKPNGLGMGLAISHDIIEAHGGRLRAENNATGGARFTFTLPVVEGGGNSNQ